MAIDSSVPTSSVTIVLRGKTATLAYHAGETILETARRGGVNAPYSCESGICGTCLARLKSGAVTMKANDVLTEEEIAEGLVLTCQSVPTTETIIVEY